MILSTSKPPLSDTQQAIDWLVRLRSDDMSDGEMYAFADWLSQDYAHTNAFAAAENLFNDMALTAKSTAIPAECSKLAKPGYVKPVKKPRSLRKTYRHCLAYAVGLAAIWLFAVTLIIPKQTHLLDDYLSDYHTQTGEIREILLSDGSQLLLNTNSAVSIDYTDMVRQVTLHHGQVSFTVAKDVKRRFEVITENLLVRALGTVFEVYNPDSDEITVTVQEHAVEAFLQTTAAEQVLAHVKVQEGQQLHYHLGNTLEKPEPAELSQTSAWQHHQLFINDRPLIELVTELDRYRVGRIFLSDTKLKNLRVTGVFSLDKPDEVLHSIRKVLALEETRLGPWWVLLHR